MLPNLGCAIYTTSMISIIFAFLCFVAAFWFASVRKTYASVPLAELRRRANKHDVMAKRLYEAASYGASLQTVLWVFVIFFSCLGAVLFVSEAPSFISLIVLTAALYLAYVWLPRSRVKGYEKWITSLTTAFLARIMAAVTPPIRWLHNIAKQPAPFEHTMVFEREDLIELLTRQQTQADSRLNTEELEIVKHVLTFGDYAVRDVMKPRSGLRTVHANETIGPILIDELHQAHMEHVLVQDSQNSEIVGTLTIGTLGIHSSGKVRDAMESTIYYLHESDSLSVALHAFFVTNHPLFVVTNSYEEFVGVLSVQSLLKRLIGHIPGQEFEDYANVHAVAARHPRPKKRSEPINTSK